MEAFLIAHHRVVNGRKDLLIIILKEKMNLDNLPPELKTYLRMYLFHAPTSVKRFNVLSKKNRFPHKQP